MRKFRSVLGPDHRYHVVFEGNVSIAAFYNQETAELLAIKLRKLVEQFEESELLAYKGD